MHILILPSEEFVPPSAPLAGIFQHHQAAILSEAGYKVGVISVKQTYSIPMLIKSLLFKCLKKKVNNTTDNLTFSQILVLGYKKLFNLEGFIEVENKEKIHVYRIDGFYYWAPSDITNRSGWINAGMVAFEAYVKDHGTPQVIHAHNALYAAMLANKIKNKYSIPYIITEHSSAFAKNTITSPILLKHVKNAYQNSDGAYAVSHHFGNLLGNLFSGISFNYLPNVLDPYLEEKQYISEVKENKKEFIFLNIAELHPKKNQKLLIDGFKKLKQLHPELSIKLWIAGGGLLYNELKNHITSSGLDSDVKLLGHLNRDQVFDTIIKCDCFVLSSPYETFGVVLIEAMLLGKPVISSQCGGPQSFVNDKNGILVSKDNEDEFYKAMAHMVKHAKTYNPQTIREFVINEFGQKAFVHRMSTIYNQLITG